MISYLQKYLFDSFFKFVQILQFSWSFLSHQIYVKNSLNKEKRILSKKSHYFPFCIYITLTWAQKQSFYFLICRDPSCAPYWNQTSLNIILIEFKLCSNPLSHILSPILSLCLHPNCKIVCSGVYTVCSNKSLD